MTGLAADHARTRNCDPLSLISGRGKHTDELAGPQPAGIVLDLEIHRPGLVAVGKAAALINQWQRASPAGLGHRALGAGQRIEAQRLNPEPRWLDDLKQNSIRL